jgi:exo-1,4-beta-D-glucosaminidase
VRTAVAAGNRGADVTVRADVRNTTGSALTTTVAGTVHGPDGAPVALRQAVLLAAGERRTVTFSPADTPGLRLARPALWWPVGLGSQPLYTARLTAGTGAAAAPSDAADTTFGVRQIASTLDA